MGLFGFGNSNAVMSRGGYSSTTTVNGSTYTSGAETGWSKIGEVNPSTSSTVAQYGGAALSLAQAGMNIASYGSQMRQAKKNMTTSILNMGQIAQEYEIEDLRLRQQTYKVLGAIQARTGEGGSGLDLLQESAFNSALEAYNLRQQYNWKMYAEYRNYKKAKTAKNKANRGRVGAIIGTAGAVVAAPFTGGASLAFAGTASQVGGAITSGM